jgi:hypothetical protein
MASRGGLCVAVVVLVWLVPRSALSAPAPPDGSSLSRAHDAYARGAAAFSQKDYARAARELAAADALVPDPVTLRAALDAVTLADDAVLGQELVARARRERERDKPDSALARSASIAEQRFLHRTGTLVVRCEDCIAVIDGTPAVVGEPRVVLPGAHTVSVQRHGAPETRLVPVAVDEAREVRVRKHESIAEPPPPPPPEPERSGVAPAWFVAAAVGTVALGAVTIGSAVDLANDHASFVSASCQTTGTSACDQRASAGRSAQARTLGLGVATGVFAAGTGALAAFVTWKRSPTHEVGLALGAASAQLRVSF